MFCATCGEKLNDGALFCAKCGVRLDAEKNAPSFARFHRKKSVRKGRFHPLFSAIVIGIFAVILVSAICVSNTDSSDDSPFPSLASALKGNDLNSVITRNSIAQIDEMLGRIPHEVLTVQIAPVDHEIQSNMPPDIVYDAFVLVRYQAYGAYRKQALDFKIFADGRICPLYNEAYDTNFFFGPN